MINHPNRSRAPKAESATTGTLPPDHDFKPFSAAVDARYAELCKGELFVADVENIFDTYLAAYPAGTNPIFRERTTHDCNCCKQFIRKLGVLVSVSADGATHSLWDNLDLPYPYDAVAARLSDVVRQAPIRTVFRSKERSYGTDHNYDTKTNERWEHFHGKVASKHYSTEPETKRSELEAVAQVLRRGLKEIKAADLETVLDLVDSNSLYRGEEHRSSVAQFRDLQRKYDGNENFVWANLGSHAARFRNTVIGTLLVDLAEGKPLEDAVRMFESKVAPTNYKRPTALITAKMVEQAVETLNSLGLEGAVHRRFARLSDVSVNNVLFVDNAVRGTMKGGIAGLLSDGIKPKAVNTDKAESISVENFLANVVPSAKGMEVFLQNRHAGNFVSLTGGDGPERLFKWDNNFAWSYDGEVTDSIKQRVKAAGGNINALLRVSLGWFNYDDLDIHCITPDQGRIFYGNKAGVLDVDMNAAGRRDSRTPVENLAFNNLRDGEYRVLVNNFMRKETVDLGFTIEVEYQGITQQFSYTRGVKDKENVEAALLTVKNGRLVKIQPGPDMSGGGTSNEKWGVQTEGLIPVTVLMNSPNHWDGQGVGQKHWFFMLKGCKNPDAVRGIYNEFLRGDLEKHRKVFEVLGSKTKCPPTDDQISGVGFSASRNDTVTVVVNGGRAYNINF